MPSLFTASRKVSDKPGCQKTTMAHFLSTNRTSNSSQKTLWDPSSAVFNNRAVIPSLNPHKKTKCLQLTFLTFFVQILMSSSSCLWWWGENEQVTFAHSSIEANCLLDCTPP